MSERTRVTLLLAVAVLLYGNTLLNDFALDDNMYVLSNPAMAGPSWKGILQPVAFNNAFRPLTFVTLAVNRVLGGFHPLGYHLVNLLINAAAVLLLYFVLKELLESVPESDTIAWVTALLFAAHPIHTEAVASVSNRTEPLAAAFLLAAWLFHLRGRPLLAVVLFVLALLSKESAVVFVPLVVAGDYARGKMQPYPRYVALFATAVLYVVLLWTVHGGHLGEKQVLFLNNPLLYLPVSLRILNALRVTWKYLGLLAYPAKLSSDYAYNAITLYTGAIHFIWTVVATLALLLLWLWTFWTKRREWFLAISLFVLSFAVTANILVATGAIMGERLMYLPSAGFCLLVALLWMHLASRYRRPAWILLCVLLLALGARTVARNQDWHDNFTLFAADVHSAPGSAKIHANLGAQYLYHRQLDDAGRELRAALAIYPEFPDAEGNLALVEAAKGNDQEARRILERARAGVIPEDPNYAYISVNLATVLMDLHENAEALTILNEIVARTPGYARAWANRAVIHYQTGQIDLARSDAAAALQRDPGNQQAANLLALLNHTGNQAQ